MKLIKKTLVSALLVALVLSGAAFLAPRPALAGDCVCSNNEKRDAKDKATCDALCGSIGSTTKSFTPTTSTPTPGTTAGGLTNPLGGSGICAKATGIACVQLIIGNVIKGALGIVGSLALLMIVWGGFLWLTSRGDANQVKKGQATLMWAVIGLATIFGAYAATSYVIDKITSGTKAPVTSGTGTPLDKTPAQMDLGSGSPCETTDQCQSGLTCQVVGTGMKMCLLPTQTNKQEGQPCNDSNECAGGLVCGANLKECCDIAKPSCN